jgi:hypothetical protein
MRGKPGIESRRPDAIGSDTAPGGTSFGVGRAMCVGQSLEAAYAASRREERRAERAFQDMCPEKRRAERKPETAEAGAGD